jgi:hypothetical protein
VAPPTTKLPLILGGSDRAPGLNAVLHRTVSVVLPIYETGGSRNRTAGHDLGNENNSSSILAGFFASNIEAQVYLIEIGVKWNGKKSE